MKLKVAVRYKTDYSGQRAVNWGLEELEIISVSEKNYLDETEYYKFKVNNRPNSLYCFVYNDFDQFRVLGIYQTLSLAIDSLLRNIVTQL
jgi:hypothetical protein